MENQFAQQLSQLRQERRLSQAGLANKLYVSRQAISKWENGDAEPSFDKLITLAETLGVDLNRLVTGTAATAAPLLTLAHVSKQFDQPVLRDINLTVHAGERIAVLGANGAGKTTLFQLIHGGLAPDTGTINCQFERAQAMNVMPQDVTLLTHMTVRDHLRLTTALLAIDTIDEDALLTRFQLAKHAKKVIATLSGGQQRRLAVLLSMLRPAKVTLLDEPTVGTDLASVDHFWEQLTSIAGSVMVITHDFNQIDQYFSRVLLVQNGQIAYDRPVGAIHAQNQTLEQWYRHVTSDQKAVGA